MKNVSLTPLTKRLTKTITIPGSKSYTNRALFLATLTPEPVVIRHPLISDDTKAMIDCLKTLGITITIEENCITVKGSIEDIKEKEYKLDANISGITIRFMTALATMIPGIKTIHGKEGLNRRPIKDLVDGLRQLGAEITYEDKEGFPPLRITSQKLTPGTVMLHGSISSQYLSALLMIAPLVGDVTIKIEEEQISKPYIDMTIATMKQFGVTVRNNDYKEYAITKQTYHATDYTVEGDFSSAGYFFAIAALTESTLTLKNLNTHSKQADKKLLSVLEKMGSTITYGENEITIVGKGVKPMTVDVTDFPDQAQTLAVLAAFAKGETTLKGVQSLRVKETERVIALQKELSKMGIKTKATHDTLTIFGGNQQAATIDTYGDHRMAMSFAVAGTMLSGMTINNPEVVSKTFPDFWKKLKELSSLNPNPYTLAPSNIILIGMRGSGKTTVAKYLAEKTKKIIIDLDELFAKHVGMSITQFVEKNGWDAFREEESSIAQKEALRNNTIIATGGGVILNPENITALKKHGTIVYLKTPIETLLQRIGIDPERPALTDQNNLEEEMKKILNQRKSFYEQAADIIIETDNKDPENIAKEIINEITIP